MIMLDTSVIMWYIFCLEHSKQNESYKVSLPAGRQGDVMDKNLVQAQDAFLGGMKQICNKFGLNSIMAQVYAAMYLSNKPLSLNDMVERLKISKGSASINIRALERYGVVRRVWVKGSRRDFYEAESDISRVIIDRVKSMAQSRLGEVNDMVNSAYRALDSVNCSDEEEKEDINTFKERLEKLSALQKKAQAALNIVSSGLVGNLLGTKTKK